jgi:hypothetical protein
MGAPISLVGYAEILAFLKSKSGTYRGSTSAEVAAHLGKNVETVRLLLRRMNRARLIHVARWSEPALHVVPRPLYMLGDKPDAAPPLTCRGKPSRHQVVACERLPLRPALIAFTTLVRALKEGPHSRMELAEETGLNPDALMRVVKRMHALRLIHIGDWDKPRSGPAAPRWEWGGNQDVPPPPKQRRRAVKRAIEARRQRRQQLRLLKAIGAQQWFPSLRATPLQPRA